MTAEIIQLIDLLVTFGAFFPVLAGVIGWLILR